MITTHPPVRQSHDTLTSEESRRLSWMITVADQLADEAGLQRLDDIDDIVAIAYVGLLNSPPPENLSYHRLLELSRHQLLIWAWEQGGNSSPLPLATQPVENPNQVRSSKLTPTARLT